MAVGDVYQLDLNHVSQGNQNVYCYFFWETVSTTGSSDPTELLIDQFISQVMPKIQAFTSAGVNFECIVVKKVASNLIDVPRIRPLGTNGDRVDTEELPGQCSMVVQSLPSDVSVTPRTRGRDFITGLLEGDQIGGDWTQDAANLVLDAYETGLIVNLEIDGATYEWINYSFTQSNENDDPKYESNGGTVPDPSTFGNPPQVKVDRVLAVKEVRTQRRRQPEDPCSVPYTNQT